MILIINYFSFIVAFTKSIYKVSLFFNKKHVNRFVVEERKSDKQLLENINQCVIPQSIN